MTLICFSGQLSNNWRRFNTSSLNGKVLLNANDLKESPNSYFFINDKGIVVTIPEKFSTDFFKYDLIRRSNKSERVIIRKRSTNMMLDYAGNIIVPFDKYKIDMLSRDSPHFSFQDSSSKWGLLDRHGKIVVEAKFNKQLENYPEFNVKIGYDSINSVIFDSSLNSKSYPYEEIIPVSRKMNNNVYRVKKDGRWGVLHGTKEIIPPQWGGVIINESLGLFICAKEGEISVFNLQGELILNSDMISVKYDKLSFLLIEKKRKYQYYDLRYKDPTEHVRKVKKAKLHEDWNSTLIPSLVSKVPYIVRIYTKRKGFMFVDSLGEPMMSNYANCRYTEPAIFNRELIGFKCIEPDFDFKQSFENAEQNVEYKQSFHLLNGVVIDDNYHTVSFNPENGYFLALKESYIGIYSVQGEKLMSFLPENRLDYYDSRLFNELAKKDNEYTQRVKEILEKTGVSVSRLDDMYILESNKGKKIILNMDKETISALYDKIETRPHHLICAYSESKSSDILDRNGKLLYSNVTINNGPGFSFDQNGIRYWMTINGEIYAKTKIKF